jgi:S1-C subfamily serine protease
VRQHQILSTDRIGTPTDNKVPFHYIQVSGAPVSGRSGGGLFSSEGYLIGVCNTADPKEDDGQFVPPSMIRYILKNLKLNEVYEKPSLGNSADKTMLAAQLSPAAANPLAGREESSGMQLQPMKVAELPQRAAAVSPSFAAPAAVQPNKMLPQMSPAESATLEEIQRRMKDGDEVILITRSRRNPENPTDVIVLNGTSDQFLQALTQKQAAEKYNPEYSSEYNPVIFSSHEGQAATVRPRLANSAQPSGQRPVTFPVLH